MTEKSKAVSSFLRERYPDARCALVFQNPFQCLVAIVLSAQTSDKSVNSVTPALFHDFPTPFALAEADVSMIEEDIRRLGLYHHKALYLKRLGQALSDNGGAIPQAKEELTRLPGVGGKTAGVFLLETMRRPAIPVDTHIGRIAIRLGFSTMKDSPYAVERKLEKSFPQEDWGFLHHALIAFGRDCCHAKNPDCGRCGLRSHCRYFKKNASTIGK